jgi:hypothetical protein
MVGLVISDEHPRGRWERVADGRMEAGSPSRFAVIMVELLIPDHCVGDHACDDP